MIAGNERERLQPSLLDRLIDDAPEQLRESPDQRSLNMAQLRRAVLRDLTWLLNTTNLATTEDLDGWPAAAGSTINFGIPGLAGTVQSSRRVTALEGALRDAIRRFEPRILPDSLRVRVRRSDGYTGATLNLDIEGELWAQPVPQRVFLETTVSLESGGVLVTDARTRS